MSTYERQIDALGGTCIGNPTAWEEGYHQGYTDALTDACLVAAKADQVIAELIETIEDMLNGYPAKKWAEQADTLVRRVKGRVQ